MQLQLALTLNLVQESNAFQSIAYNLVESSLWQVWKGGHSLLNWFVGQQLYLNKDNRQLLAEVQDYINNITAVPYSVDPAPYSDFIKK